MDRRNYYEHPATARKSVVREVGPRRGAQVNGQRPRGGEGASEGRFSDIMTKIGKYKVYILIGLGGLTLIIAYQIISKRLNKKQDESLLQKGLAKLNGTQGSQSGQGGHVGAQAGERPKLSVDPSVIETLQNQVLSYKSQVEELTNAVQHKDAQLDQIAQHLQQQQQQQQQSMTPDSGFAPLAPIGASAGPDQFAGLHGAIGQMGGPGGPAGMGGHGSPGGGIPPMGPPMATREPMGGNFGQQSSMAMGGYGPIGGMGPGGPGGAFGQGPSMGGGAFGQGPSMGPGGPGGPGGRGSIAPQGGPVSMGAFSTEPGITPLPGASVQMGGGAFTPF